MKADHKQLWVISLIVFISFVGTSIAYPIFPPLFLYPAPDSIIPLDWHENARSIFLGIALAAYPLGQFLGSPILGGCSDRYGRKKMLMLSLIGSILGYTMTALSLQFNWLWLLLLSRLITGAMEGNFAIARAMAIDLDSISKFKSLGQVNAVGAIGYVIGPLFGGLLSDPHIVPWFSFAFPFYFAMFFSLIAALLAGYQLVEKPTANHSETTIWQRFNLPARFRVLFKNSPPLKYLLIISTLFAFSVDIFYEFGPVYLTGLWAMTPAGIALYNGILSFTLAAGAGWLPQHLSFKYSVERVIVCAMLATSIVLGLMALFPYQAFVFILFGLAGLSIAIVNTNMTIQISNAADKTIQGEAMGAQLSLRMLGDAFICLSGGFIILSSVILPIAISCFVAGVAVIAYSVRYIARR